MIVAQQVLGPDGRLYPERLDDMTWENDRGIYRVYGPAKYTK